MADEPNTLPSPVDGGEPLDLEAKLAAQVNTIGDDPKVEPTEVPPGGVVATIVAPGVAAAAAGGAEAGTTTAAAGNGDGTVTGAVAQPPGAAGDTPPVDPAVAAAAAAAAAEAAKAADAAAVAAAAAAVAPPARLDPRPDAPKDFEAEFAALQKKYDDGEIDSADFQTAQRTLSREEGAFTARVTIWEDRQQTAQAVAAQDFNAAAAAWEKEHSAFMQNPIRRDAMQRALADVDASTGGKLAPAELIKRAGDVAFEAFGYVPPTPVAGTDATAAIAASLAARAPGRVPQTLASAPAAAPIEKGSGNALYAELDAKGIDDLENAMARMTEAQKDAYLRDAPGSTSTGIPGN